MPRWTILLFCFSLLLTNPAFAQTSCTALTAEQDVRLTGFTRARAVMSVVSEVSGRCLEVLADTGDPIAAEGVFARLDPTFTTLDLEANHIHRQEAKRQLRYDDQEVKRYQDLVRAKSTARVHLDQLELQRDRSRLELSRLEIEARRLREKLDRYTVRAPCGWRVIKRSVEPGEWVQAGKTLARLGDYQTLIVPLALTTAELKSLRREGKSIALVLPEENITGTGRLDRISPGFDPITRKLRVEIALSHELFSRLHLKQGGIRVDVPLKIPDPMHAFIIPAAAVQERFEEHWLTRENGMQIRVIVLGPARAPDNDDREWLRITSKKIRENDAFLLPPRR